MKLNKVSTELEKLGYNPDASTSLYIETAGGIANSLLGNLSVLKNKFFIASFQPTGILFIGLNKFDHFNGTSHFTPLSEIGEVSISKVKFINGRLLLNAEKLEIADASGNKSKYICYTFLARQNWKPNIENVKQFVTKWPSIAERQATPEIAKQPQTEDATDQLRKYKSLLDDGVISEEEFNAKKKQLLNL